MRHHPGVSPVAPEVIRRRRLSALGAVGGVALLAGMAIGAGAGEDGGGRDRSARAAQGEEAPPPPQLPRGGRSIFPEHRVVAFYGAPQAAELGELGIGSPDSAARRLRRQAAPYARKTRPVLPAMELIATIANAHPGLDGMYRTQQPHSVIRRYLRAARRAKALLVLDIQPGHADFTDEVRRLDRYLREPDVGLALDPEWHTPGAVPGTQIGSVSAEQVNAVSRHVSRIVREHNLPEKLFVVHQFTVDMVRDKQRVEQPGGLAVTMNVDGFGTRSAKLSKYRLFTNDGKKFNDGLKLFYREDTGLMKPRSVLALEPPPDLVVYE
jgi:hypothetical protein